MKAAAIRTNSPTVSDVLDRPGSRSERATIEIRVLLVEDNPVDAMRLRQLLSRARSARMVVESVSNLPAGLERIGQGNLDLVLLDLTLPESDGVEGLLAISYAAPAMPVIVLASPATEGLGIEGVRLGAQDCILKSQANPAGLGRAIRCAIERHQMVATLRGMSLADEMTGLLNRRGFQTIATGHLKLGNRTGSRFLLFFFDLDDLKLINDTWGHHEGDHAIMRTAEVLRATFRQSDVVARYGGDEFVVLALDSSSDGGAAIRARLEAKLARANVAGNGRYCLGLSVGVVAFDALQDRPLSDLLREADRALYREKFARR